MKAKNVTVDIVENENGDSITEKVNDFHIDVIRRRFDQSNFTLNQKVEILDKIIQNLSQ